MSKKNGLFMLAVGAVGGYLACKYGKQMVETAKNSVDRKSIEELANEIKDSMKASVEGIKNTVEEIRKDIEFADYADLDDCFDDEKLNTKSDEKPNYIKVSVNDLDNKNENEPKAKHIDIQDDTIVENKENEIKDEDVPPLEIKIAENPEKVREEANKLLDEAEKAIQAELNPGLEKLRARKKSNTKKTTKKSEKVENSEIENKAEDSKPEDNVK